jgi:hypothetical protein
MPSQKHACFKKNKNTCQNFEVIRHSAGSLSPFFTGQSILFAEKIKTALEISFNFAQFNFISWQQTVKLQ